MTEEDGVTVATGGVRPEFDFEPRDHLALAGPLIDTERGARTSGSRFAYLHGDLVRLHLSLVQYALAKLSAKQFLPTMPPVLVREPALFGTGFFPADREQVYSLDPARDDLFLVGTSEVSLAALHMGEILDEDALPLRYAGISSCFRREAGSAGRDTRGIFRTHQFDKVEMFSFCHPDRSWDEHDLILSLEREIADELGLHYRVVNIAVGDLGDSAAKKYDIEAWLPGQGRYRELTSCSNTTDYQARRLECRMRTGKGTRVLHTLNGTAITSSRTLIAVLETHQRADGSVAVPQVLHAFGAPAVIGPPPDLG
jgi:seryl-tRNA synthetase